MSGPVAPAGVASSEERILAAAAVLERNWMGTHTVPATGLYPHQWSWDSAFIAIGLRHVAPGRARTELSSLLSAGWHDGRLPQIVYDVSRDDDYAPGDAFWRSRTLPTAGPVPSSGLVQPPNHAWAAWLVHEADPEGSAETGWLASVYEPLAAWHRYLEERRASPSAPDLAVVRHPWEPGTDNSPLWDEALARVPSTPRWPIRRPDLAHAGEGERPGSREYAKYYWLAEQYRDAGCDDAAPATFLMTCPMFNALLAVSELALGRIADALGRDGSGHRARAPRIAAALEQLWDPELGSYVARDEVAGASVREVTINGLAPLLVPGIAHADELVGTITGPRFLGATDGGAPARFVASYDRTARGFDPALYWRGPAWFSTNWLIWRALQWHGDHALAARIAPMLTDEAGRHEFPEYVDPVTGAPRGTRRFSWTAALAIDALRAPTLPLVSDRITPRSM